MLWKLVARDAPAKRGIGLSGDLLANSHDTGACFSSTRGKADLMK